MPSIITGIKLTDSVDSIENKIIRAFADELNDRLSKVASDIKLSLQSNMARVFTTSYEYNELVHGPLGQHFGISSSDAIRKLDKIIDTLSSSVQVDFTKITVSGRKNLKGGLTVYAFQSDFADILSLSEANVQTDKGQNLPWLDWLLIQGDRIILTDYDIAFGNYATSRAGGAVMVEKKGGFWKVPMQYSGTPDDNWITRSIIASSNYLEDLMAATIKYNIEKAI